MEKNTNYNIKAFLFDLGNVIIPFDNYIAARKIKKYTKRSVQEIYDIIFDSPIVKDFSEGKINPKEFFSGIKGILGLNENITYPKFKSIWNSIFLEENKDVSSLIKKLMLNYKVIIVSNINEIHYEYIEKNYDIMKEINEKVLSYKIGVNKPHSKIYQIAIRKTQAKPESIIYIDDREDLIKAGKNLRLHCIHYKGYDELIEDLRKFKIIT